MTGIRRSRSPRATIPARRKPRRQRPDWGRRAIAVCNPSLSADLRRRVLLWSGYGGLDTQAVVDRVARTGWPLVADNVRQFVAVIHSAAGLSGPECAAPRIEAIARLVEIAAHWSTREGDRAHKFKLLDSIESAINAEPPKACRPEAWLTASVGQLDPATADLATMLCAFNWIANEGIWATLDLYAKGIALRTFRDHGRRCGRELVNRRLRWLKFEAIGPAVGAWIGQEFSDADARLVVSRARARLSLSGEGSK